MGETNGIWKRLFFVLHYNKQTDIDLPNIWTRFKQDNFRDSDLELAIRRISHLLQESEKEKLNSIRSAYTTSTHCERSLLDFLNDDLLLKDDSWYLLFKAVRDIGCSPLDKDMQICVLEGGQTKLMLMEEVEQKFITENKDDTKSQTSVPDQLIHEDLIDACLSTSTVGTSLKEAYKARLEEAKTSLKAENPRLKVKEVEKQAAGQAKKEVKGSRDAKTLQKRLAMMAEHEVQKSIKSAMEKFNIPVYIFRGVNTYDDVGHFLESFGIKMSKLKAFKSGEGTLECEHDIAIIALLPCGPLVSFIQVKILF